MHTKATTIHLKNRPQHTYHFSANFITDTNHGVKLLGIAEGRFHPGDRGGGKGSGRADDGGDDGGLHGCFGVDRR